MRSSSREASSAADRRNKYDNDHGAIWYETEEETESLKVRKLPAALLNEITDIAYSQLDIDPTHTSYEPHTRVRLPSALLNDLKVSRPRVPPTERDEDLNTGQVNNEGPMEQQHTSLSGKSKLKSKSSDSKSPSKKGSTTSGSTDVKNSPKLRVNTSGTPLQKVPLLSESNDKSKKKKSPRVKAKSVPISAFKNSVSQSAGNEEDDSLKAKTESSYEHLFPLVTPVLPRVTLPEENRVLSQQDLYNVTFKVFCDDMFYQATDAIIVTTFDKRYERAGFGLGVAALKIAGEDVLEKFIATLSVLRRSRSVNNQVVATVGGDLKCKHIIHVNVPDTDDTLTWKCILTQNITESLQKCEKDLQCVSITIPLLYSSFWHFNLGRRGEMEHTCAEVIVSAVLDYFLHMSSRSSIRKVIFIDKIPTKALAFKKALEKYVVERKASRPYRIPTQLFCEYTYPDSQTRLIVATGNPTKQSADVLMNPTANYNVSYSGLTARILVEAGLSTDTIQEAFASSKGHQKNTVATSAGKLPFQQLYHVRGNDENATDFTQQSLQIETCTFDCLNMAEQAGVETVVLPIISNRYTSIGEYQCSYLMLNAIHRFMTKFKRKGLKEVYLYTGYASNAVVVKDELTIRYGDEVTDIKGGQVPLEVLARGLEANIAFLDAIEEGSKSIYQTRLMLVGQERVGKTSLTKALTGQEFNDTEEVTDGIETSLSCTLSVKHTTNWKPKQTEGKTSEARQQYLRAVAEKIATKLLQKKKKASKKDERKKQECNSSGAEQGMDGNSASYSSSYNEDYIDSTYEDYVDSDSAEDQTDAPVSISSQEEATTPTTPDVPEEVIQMVLNILVEKEKLGQTEELDQVIDDETIDDLTLSIWDFAGQDLYYITHQVFLVSRAIYIICFNLCHDLNAPAKVEVFNRDGGKISVSDHYMNNKDFVIFWLRSIYSHTTENASVSKQRQLSPPVFIVGTHRESLPGNAQQRQALAEEKLAEVKKSLKGTPYEGHVVCKFYAIDNSLRPLDQSIIDLRDHITLIAKQEHYMGEKIPLKWLDFLNEIEQLRNKEKHSISYKQVRDLASSCGILNDIQLFTMLHFYHDLGNMIYYGERDTPDSALNDIIILSPQWLICIFKRVITVKDPSEQWAKFRSAWARLDEEGLLEERLIRHMWHDFLDQLEGLLQLMQKFDLLCVKTQSTETQAAVEGNRLFYVPSLLKNQGDEVICLEHLMKSKTAVVLYIDFNGFLPEGLFYRLIVRLVQWSQLKGGYEPRLFFQQANLYVNEDHDMVIRILPNKRSCIQVVILRASTVCSDDEEEDEEDEVEPCPSVCKMVLELLENNLLYLGHTWMKRVHFGFFVLCRVCYKEKTHLHELKKCLNSKLVPCGLQRMKTARFRRLFGDSKPKQGHQATVTASPVKPKVPVFLRSLSGIFKEISAPILPFDLMTEICVLLDPEHPLANDWRGVACKLGYDHYINYLARKDSPTMCIMNGWSEKGWSLEDLKKCMIDIKRGDVVRLIDKHLLTKLEIKEL
ncbi:uncharacterized protein [Antedon mediterranea]|uniref:uncharacterized protein isoform X2 n=1 Tax=Antedon mediterranea TaxID=105859 RepID=UPI003AF52EF2